MTYDPLTHDPVLDAWLNALDDDPNYSDYLDLIARVREDEEDRWLPRYNAAEQRGYNAGERNAYAAGLRSYQRFLEKVDTSGDCWMWLGYRNGDGYGRFQWEGTLESAHRVSAMLFKGPIPDGLHVLHTCDEPGCVRPDHLFYGDHATNMQDMVAKGRHALQHNPEQAKAINANGKRKWRTPKKDVCKNGHPLTGDNVRIGTNGNGKEYQVCVTCKREQSLAAYHRRKEQP